MADAEFPSDATFGPEIISRIEALGAISETPGQLTRIFLTPQHRAAADLLLTWMRDAGMAAQLDAIGNVCGRYEGEQPGAPCLMLGSHYDTVRDAGKWDGPLGLVTAICCVADSTGAAGDCRSRSRCQVLPMRKGFVLRPPCWAAARSPERLTRACSGVKDGAGVTMRDALTKFGLDPDHIGAAARARGELLAYVELHIEQGPVLEALKLPVGVVTAIAGATRLAASLTGMAGHAGTVPMPLRRDALAGAAECIVEIEEFCRTDEDGLVGTVGYIHARPGATNVIPGQVSFTLDIRAPTDAHRKLAVADIVRRIETIAKRRKLCAAARRHPREPHRALRALAEAPAGRCRRGRRFPRVRTAERRRP